MQIIQTANLSKTYTRFEKEEGLKGSVKSLFARKIVTKRAVENFDFEVQSGEFIGLIGPNGAGKTTLVKLMTGIIRKSSGELQVLGYDPNRLQDDFKRQYAVVMGQKSQLFPTLSAADAFLLFREIYAIDEVTYRKNLEMFVELFDVREQLNVQVRTLSLGERMKMELIAALLHNPKVLFLDEPTIGLDAVAQRQIRRFLSEINREKGTTILLTSHYMEDIRSLCNRCVLINHGLKRYDGDLRALFDEYQTKRKISVTLASPQEFTPRASVEWIERSPYRLSFLAQKEDAKSILREMFDHLDISDMAIEEEEIGDVVARIYARGEGVS